MVTLIFYKEFKAFLLVQLLIAFNCKFLAYVFFLKTQ